MIMKKMKLWSMMMLMLVTLPLMVACGGDDDEGSGNSGYDGVLTITIDGNEHQYTTSGEFGLEIVKYFNNSHDLTFILYSMSGSNFKISFPNTWKPSDFVVGYKDFAKDATKFRLGSQIAKYESGTATVIKNEGQKMIIKFDNFAFSWLNGKRTISFDGSAEVLIE
jgi:hypothetical protein